MSITHNYRTVDIYQDYLIILRYRTYHRRPSIKFNYPKVIQFFVPFVPVNYSDLSNKLCSKHHSKLFYNIPTIVFQINMDQNKNQHTITNEISCTITM